jgi:hypothetical protein
VDNWQIEPIHWQLVTKKRPDVSSCGICAGLHPRLAEFSAADVVTPFLGTLSAQLWTLR